ncbi:DUF3253 domain-containing protein [Jannaschia formosa]|nr:DUF3253 domain-containing protein [Jannaschia formosa]
MAATILRLTEARTPRTICPSEAARALSADWRPLMPRIRAVAATLPQIEATQGGARVDAETAIGPICLRRLRPGRPG